MVVLFTFRFVLVSAIQPSTFVPQAHYDLNGIMMLSSGYKYTLSILIFIAWVRLLKFMLAIQQIGILVRVLFRIAYDLMPVVPEYAPSNDAHVSLLTSSAPAAVVGPAIADELERLGYTLEPKNDRELKARRNTDELVLGIVTSPAMLTDGDRPRYPTAADGDVLITIDAVS